MLDWTNGDDITLRPKVEISPHDRAAIAEIAPRRYGKGPRIKLHSKSRALDALARHLGVYDKTMPAVDPAQMMKQRQATREKIMRRINQIVEERIAERCKAGTLIVAEPGPGNSASPSSFSSPSPPERGRGQGEGVLSPAITQNSFGLAARGRVDCAPAGPLGPA